MKQGPMVAIGICLIIAGLAVVCLAAAPVVPPTWIW